VLLMMIAENLLMPPNLRKGVIADDSQSRVTTSRKSRRSTAG
jgi:hypothetical protein